MPYFLSFLLMLMTLVGFVAPAAADDRSTCFDAKSAPDVAIAACDRFIMSGATGDDRTLAHDWRGHAYYGKGDYDRAIRDLDEAIRLDPKMAEAYNTRSFAFGRK